MKEMMTGALVFLMIGFGMVEGAVNWALTGLGL